MGERANDRSEQGLVQTAMTHSSQYVAQDDLIQQEMRASFGP